MLRAPLPATLAVRLLATAALVSAVVVSAGCGIPPELRRAEATAAPSGPCTGPPTLGPVGIPEPGQPPASPRTGTPGKPNACTPTTVRPQPAPTGTPTWQPPSAPVTIGGATALACGGQPSGEQIVDLLRRSEVLPHDVAVSIVRQPLCADGWQYTVVQVADHEPLQVVSKGEPGLLTLVTAGTDVCSIEVRSAAPGGIRVLVC